MRNVSDKSCRENQNTHFVLGNFFNSKIVPFIKWKNFAQQGRPQMTTWRMRIACWITKVTNIQSEYVILIAFPLQQWLNQRALLLRYTCIVCLVQ
jgi:hypothetical protein